MSSTDKLKMDWRDWIFDTTSSVRASEGPKVAMIWDLESIEFFKTRVERCTERGARSVESGARSGACRECRVWRAESVVSGPLSNMY